MKTLRTLRRLFGLAAGLLLLVTAPSEAATASYRILHELDDAAVAYCRMLGSGGNPYAGAISGDGKITTSGSSTTVTAETAGSLPFGPLSVGDVIAVRTGPAETDVALRVLTAKASGDSVTVNTAVDWSTGYAFTWWKLECGTGVTAGWISTAQFKRVTFQFQIQQMNATAVDFRIECKGAGPDAQPNIVYPGEDSNCGPGTLTSGYCRYTAAGIADGRHAVVMYERQSACRVGVKIDTDDGGDTGANAEQITVEISGDVEGQ